MSKSSNEDFLTPTLKFPLHLSRSNYRSTRSLLFDVADDEEDEEDEAYYTDAFDGMKQRMTTLNGKTDKMEKVRSVCAPVVAIIPLP